MNAKTTTPGTARSRALSAPLAVGLCSIAILLAPLAHADDGGKSVYLLGKRGPLAAFVPKPGFYLSNDVYYYDASSSDLLPFGGDRLVQDVSAQALMDIPQFTWVTDVSVAGGRLAFSLLTPFGKLDVDGKGTVDLLNGSPGPSVQLSDSDTGFADPVVGGSIGWKHRDGDKFRAWSVYSSVWIPIGSYELGRLANLSSNRWALDVGGAYTMANFKGGRELSSVVGFTFNGDNQDTDYSSGTPRVTGYEATNAVAVVVRDGRVVGLARSEDAQRKVRCLLGLPVVHPPPPPPPPLPCSHRRGTA